jgi:hypothetical protein
MTFWTSTHERLSPSGAARRTAADASGPLSSGAVLRLLADSTDFRAWFTSMLLQDAPDAFRWETPALSLETLSRPFECVLIDDPRLQRTPEPLAFATYFQGRHAETYARSVPNLGRTSELIVPRGIASPATYVLWRRSCAARQRHRSMRSGAALPKPCCAISLIVRCGSAPPVQVWRGCTSASIVCRSITGTGRTRKVEPPADGMHRPRHHRGDGAAAHHRS